MPVDDFVAGEFPTADDLNMLPRGVLGRTVGTATSYTNATVSYTALTVTAGTAPTLTLTLSTTRMYRATFHGRFTNASATFVLIGFHEAGTVREIAQCLAIASAPVTMYAEWVFSPAAATSVVYDVRVALNGSGTIVASAAATTPIVFAIEDIGEAP